MSSNKASALDVLGAKAKSPPQPDKRLIRVTFETSSTQILKAQRQMQQAP